MMLANIPVRFYRVFGLFFKKDILTPHKSGHDSGIVTGQGQWTLGKEILGQREPDKSKPALDYIPWWFSAT